MDIQPPKGFKLDPASGLYYSQSIEKDANGNDVKAIIWLNLQTGEHRKQYYPVVQQPAPTPAPAPAPTPAPAPAYTPAAAPAPAAGPATEAGQTPVQPAPPQKKSKVGMILGIVFGSIGLIIIIVGVACFLLFRNMVSGCTSALFNPYGGFNGDSSVSHGGGSDSGPINSIGDILPGVDELPGIPDYNWDDEDPEDIEEPEEEEPEEEPDGDVMEGNNVEERLKLDSDDGGFSIDDPVPGTFRPNGNMSPNGWNMGNCFDFFYVKAQTDEEYGAYGDDYICYIQLNNDGTYEMYCSAGGDSWWWDSEFTMNDINHEMDDVYIYLYDAYDWTGNRRTAVFVVSEGCAVFVTDGFGYMGENYGTEDNPMYFFSKEDY